MLSGCEDLLSHTKYGVQVMSLWKNQWAVPKFIANCCCLGDLGCAGWRRGHSNYHNYPAFQELQRHKDNSKMSPFHGFRLIPCNSLSCIVSMLVFHFYVKPVEDLSHCGIQNLLKIPKWMSLFPSFACCLTEFRRKKASLIPKIFLNVSPGALKYFISPLLSVNPL